MTSVPEDRHLTPPAGATLLRFTPAGRACFVAGTPILTADGRERPIETLRPGDRVLGRCGRASRIVACQRARLGRQRLYAINGGPPFVTAEHPFLTTLGWKALDPEAAQRRDSGSAPAALQLGDRLCRGWAPSGGGPWPASRPGVLFVQGTMELVSIEAVDADRDTLLLDLLLEGGDHSYVAHGWIVHDRSGDDAHSIRFGSPVNSGEQNGPPWNISATGSVTSGGSAARTSAANGSDSSCGR
jgi:hypothetical protein